MGVHRSLLHFGQSQRVRQSKFTAEFFFFSSLILCVGLRLAPSLKDLWILFSPAHLFLSVFGKTSKAFGICCLLVSKRSALSTQTSQCKLHLFGSCFFRV